MTEKKFKVTWSIEVDATNEHHASTKAYDVLRSRNPLALRVSCGNKKAVTLVPYLDRQIESTIKRFLHDALVEVEIDPDQVTITVVSDYFRDIPHHDNRISMVSSMLGSLPDSYLDNFYYLCFTEEEFEAENEEEEVAAEPGETTEDPGLRDQLNAELRERFGLQPGGEAAGSESVALDQGTVEDEFAVNDDSVLAE